jgi:hypothetical protein
VIDETADNATAFVQGNEPTSSDPASAVEIGEMTADEAHAHADAQSTTAQTQEIAGRLAPDARRAVVALLKHGAVLSADKRVLFESICRYKRPLEAHLADMYLRLLVDERAGVALILQTDSGETNPREDSGDEDEENATSLITRRTLTLYETLLLLVLRKHYQDRQASGEQSIFIDLERIEDRLRPFLPLTTSTRNERRQLSGALDNMVKRKVLSRARGEQDRFEITPIIRYVVSAASLEHLLEQYTTMLDSALGSDASTPAAGDLHE